LRQGAKRRWLALGVGRAYGSIMNIRMRKLVGTVATVIFLIVYCLIAMVIGSAALTRFTFVGQALFFIAAGLAWLPIAMILVRWMQKPDDA
jgi:hypothetical protein